MSVEQLGQLLVVAAAVTVALAGVVIWLGHSIDRALSAPTPAPKRWWAR